MTERRGFAMLTVLWLLTVCAIAAMTFALDGRDAVHSGRNRVNLERTRWRALGCARRMQAAIDARLEAAQSPEDAARTWRTLARAISDDPLLAGCDVSLEAAGTKLDLNTLTPEMMSNLGSLVYGTDDADSVASAILRQRERRRFDDPRELSLIPGVDYARFDSLVSTDEGRVSLATAGVTVLTMVPGITREAAESISGRSRDNRPVSDLTEILGVVSADAADALLARFPDASRATTPDPDAWMLHARARSGDRAIEQQIVWRLTRAGYRVQILEMRMTP